jgi:tripartite-type tricarboxylate transporter receptor subunit TctC
MAQFDATHVPYRGGAPALADLVAGQINFMVENMPGTLPLVKDGKLRALAVTSPRRSSVLPEFPTVGETVPGFEVVGYFGLLAPAHTPAPIVDTVLAAVRRAIKRPEFVQRVAADGAEPDGCSPAELRTLLQRDMKTMAEVVQAANIPKQ